MKNKKLDGTMNIVQKLKLRERQKVKVILSDKKIIIKDWPTRNA